MREGMEPSPTTKSFKTERISVAIIEKQCEQMEQCTCAKNDAKEGDRQEWHRYMHGQHRRAKAFQSLSSGSFLSFWKARTSFKMSRLKVLPSSVVSMDA